MSRDDLVKSRKQEKRIAADLGGRRQVASGALWFAKDDIRVHGSLRLQYRFDIRPYRSLRKRAHQLGEIPVFVVEFRPLGESIAIFDEGAFEIDGIRVEDTIPTPRKTYLFKGELLSSLLQLSYPRPYRLALTFEATSDKLWCTSYPALQGALPTP